MGVMNCIVNMYKKNINVEENVDLIGNHCFILLFCIFRHFSMYVHKVSIS